MTLLYDGLDRPTQTQLNSDPFGTDYTATTYDALDRVYQVFNPTRCNPPTANCGEPTWGATTNSYDALNRLLSQVDSDGVGTRQWSYNGNVTTYTDENGNQWQRTYDALGRLTKVLEPSGSSKAPSIETDYTYDPLGNLLSVTQWGGANGSSGARARSFGYDGLSRLISAVNPETGTVTYGYLSNGSFCAGDVTLPCSKTDARAITANYGYDEVNRLVSKTYSNDPSGTPSSCYEYGNVSNATSGDNQIGRLINEWTQNAGTACAATPPQASADVTFESDLIYDAMGRLKSEQQYTPGNSSGAPYGVQYTYNLAGEVASSTNGVSDPGITLTMNYDGAARLKEITSSWSDATLHPADLFYSPTYGPVGLLSAEYGYNPTTAVATATLARTYDNRLRLSSETDKATEVVTSEAAAGSGSVAVTGAEQLSAYSSGSVTFSGTEQSMVSDGETIYDEGNIMILVDGMDYQIQYGQNSTPSSLAAALASSMVCYPSSGYNVQGDAVGATVYFASCSSGVSTDYSLSAYDDGHDTSFANYSFTPTASGTEMTPVTTAPTSGPVVTFSGTQASGMSSTYTIPVISSSNTMVQMNTITANSSSTPSTLAATLVADLGSCSTSGVVVTGIQNGGTVSLQPCQAGTSYYFEGQRDDCEPGSGSCIAMAITTAEYPGVTSGAVYDAGSVSLTVNGAQVASTTYGEGSTPASIASALASSNSSSSPVALTATGSGLQMTARTTGSSTDYPYSLSISSSDPSIFSPSSFGSPTPSGSLAGGANPGEQPETAYGYSIPEPSGSNCTSSGFGYDCAGNVKNVVDSVTGGWSYGYDTLNRVTGATGQSGDYSSSSLPVAGVAFGWTYDPFGNIEGQSSSSANFPTFWAHYTAANNQASATGTAPGGPTYNDSGDIESDGVNEYAYDAEDRICAVYNGYSYTGYVYDADGTRVAKGAITGFSSSNNYANACNPSQNGFQTSYSYVLDSSGRDLSQVNSSGQWQFSNVYANDLLLATYSTQSNDTYFAFNDWLGTKRAEVSPDGCLETFASLPYGDDLTLSGDCADAAPLHFTGKERDPESGNDYFGARHYASSTGRWLSPDPAGIGFANAANPQSLNLYVYVQNNPLAFVDPNGLLSCSDGKWQDVVCAVQTIFNGIKHFFSGGDNSSVSASTSDTFTVIDPGGGSGGSGPSTFQQLWNNYPRYSQYPSERDDQPYSGPGSFWQHAGGHQAMNASTFVNSCSLRMCYALNRSGVPIPYAPGRVSDADHMWGIPRLTDLQPFLIQSFGQPQHYSPDSWRGQLAGRTGIVMFQVNIWSDASGHAELWNGSELVNGKEHDYTSVSSGVLFWPIQ